MEYNAALRPLGLISKPVAPAIAPSMAIAVGGDMERFTQ